MLRVVSPTADLTKNPGLASAFATRGVVVGGAGMRLGLWWALRRGAAHQRETRKSRRPSVEGWLTRTLCRWALAVGFTLERRPLGWKRILACMRIERRTLLPFFLLGRGT